MKEIIDRTMPALIEDLKAIIRIPSVSRGEPEDGMPLGRHVHDALHCALDTAKRLGFTEARSLDGYCGVVDYGEGDEMLMIMAHLDVVPAGTGWTSDPFEPVIRDGRLYGRGVEDDKGAAIAALYALSAVREKGIPLRRRVRILFGCDEERGWKCIHRYKETEELPTLAFTPDAGYPVVHSEMGICHATYEKKLAGSGVAIRCGTASNVVPGEARATLPFAPVPCPVPDGFTADYDGNTVTVHGFGGHAAHPETAKNALLVLFDLLSQQPLSPDDAVTAASLHALFAMDEHGEGFSLDIQDASGRLTLVPTMLDWNENGVCLTLDSRYPFTCEYERLQRTLEETFGALGFAEKEISHTPGHFIDPNSELVATLMDIYETHIGHKSAPMSIGGGTYARAFPNAVAFGLIPEDEPSLCHMPDESLSLDALRFTTVVIADAIARLAGK